jgi:hypothetical protein
LCHGVARSIVREGLEVPDDVRVEIGEALEHGRVEGDEHLAHENAEHGRLLEPGNVIVHRRVVHEEQLQRHQCVKEVIGRANLAQRLHQLVSKRRAHRGLQGRERSAQLRQRLFAVVVRLPHMVEHEDGQKRAHRRRNTVRRAEVLDKDRQRNLVRAERKLQPLLHGIGAPGHPYSSTPRRMAAARRSLSLSRQFAFKIPADFWSTPPSTRKMGGCESKAAEELVDVEDDIYYRQVEWRPCEDATPLPLFVLPVLTGLYLSSTSQHFDGIKDPAKKASVMQSPLPPLSTLPAWILYSGKSKGPDASDRVAEGPSGPSVGVYASVGGDTSGPERKASEELHSRPLQDDEAAAAMLQHQHAESTRQQGYAGGQQAREDKETLAKPRGSNVSNMLLATLIHCRAYLHTKTNSSQTPSNESRS